MASFSSVYHFSFNFFACLTEYLFCWKWFATTRQIQQNSLQSNSDLRSNETLDPDLKAYSCAKTLTNCQDRQKQANLQDATLHCYSSDDVGSRLRNEWHKSTQGVAVLYPGQWQLNFPDTAIWDFVQWCKKDQLTDFLSCRNEAYKSTKNTHTRTHTHALTHIGILSGRLQNQRVWSLGGLEVYTIYAPFLGHWS